MYKYIFIILAVILCVSCKEKETYDPYSIDEESDSIEVGDSIISAFEVDFKETESNLKTIHMKLNGTNSYDVLFDTGCSYMLISSLELLDLFKSNTINKTDYVRDVVSTIADGSKIINPVYNLREVSVTDKNGKAHTLFDIEATVVDNLKAEILIGSSVIDNLAKKSYTVDLEKKIIRFE